MVTVAQCEWDKRCQQVLRYRWPDVPKWSDVSDVRGAELPDCDLLAFGSPCQDLSVAGKRAGMVKGETRSGLFYEAIRIIEELQHDGRGPTWVVWENVAGALTSNNGLDFAAVLDSLAELGAVDLQWRILDAQWFGVPQRRRRVFVIARLDPRAAGGEQVLPLGARVRRNPPPGGEAGTELPGVPDGSVGSGSEQEPVGDALPVVVGTLTTRYGALRNDEAEQSLYVPVPIRDVSACLRASSMSVDDNTAGDGHLVPAYAFGWQEDRLAGNVYEDEVPGLTTGKTYAVVQPEVGIDPTDLAVRRLTPTECCRLMGWPDDWNAHGIDEDGKQVVIADGSRYRQCGNGVASPVAEWLGRCIVAAHNAL